MLGGDKISRHPQIIFPHVRVRRGEKDADIRSDTRQDQSGHAEPRQEGGQGSGVEAGRFGLDDEIVAGLRANLVDQLPAFLPARKGDEFARLVMPAAIIVVDEK